MHSTSSVHLPGAYIPPAPRPSTPPPPASRGSSPQASTPDPQPSARGWRVPAALVIAVALLASPLVVSGATSPALSVTPSTAVPGQMVRVDGSSFPAGVSGQLYFDSSSAGMPKYRTSKQGTFSVTFTVPGSTTDGTHVVTAQNTSSGGRKAATVISASTDLVVATTSPSPAPSATPSPTAAPTAPASSTPTPAPTPTATASADPQPSFPVRAAFYYPWFPEAWNQQGMNPFTNYHPALGYYDSSSASVIQQHVAAMQYGNIGVGIASWWGPGSRTDLRLPTILSATAGSSFRWTVYYEPEGSGDPTVDQLTADLVYLRDHYGSDPSFYRIGGRFVVFVYADGLDSCGMVDRWTQANASVGAYIVLKVFSGYRTCTNQPSGWHQYGPAVAADSQAGYSYAISPGFWKANESTPRLARDLTRWNQNIRDMVASGAPFQLVTTFSEWGEGTNVESATEWASASGYGDYLDALHANGTGPVPSPTSTIAPSPTAAPPSPSPTPTTTPTGTPIPTSTPTSTPAGSTIDHTIVIWLENEEATAITATSMPYLYGLSQQYGRADAYYAVSHPSEPNYLAFWSGSTQGVTDDGVYNFGGASLSSQMTAAGRSWRTYAQDYPTSGCFTGSSYTGGIDGPGVAGTYVRKHNPAMSFTSVSGNATECAKVQPLANFDPNVNVAFVVPNLCNDAHDCSLATADAFLQGFVPEVLNAPDFAHTLLVITFDEGTTSTNGGGRIFNAVIRAGLSGVVSTTAHTHYSLLRTIESLNGLGYLGSASSANTLAEFLP